MLSEKAKSKAQQRFFGMVRAAQKGEMDNPSSEVVDAADSMKVSDVKKFAKTKHKGLPEKKEVKEGASILKVRGKRNTYMGASGDHRRDKEGNIEADFYKKKPAPTGEKWKSGRPKKPSGLEVRALRKKRREKREASSVVQTKSGKKTLDKNSNYEKLKAKIYAKDEAQSKKSREHAKKNDPNYGKSHGGRKYVYTSVKEEKLDEKLGQWKQAVKDGVIKRGVTTTGNAPKKKKKSKTKKQKWREGGNEKLKNVNKAAEKQSMQGVGGFRGVHGASRKSKAAQGKPAPVVYSYKKKEQVNEIAPAIAMAGKALLSGGVKKAAAGAVKQKAKQAVKQKAAEVAGNVADKISKPIGGTRVQESKGTAELATLALRNKKRCAECGSFAHVTGQCPKKDHGVVNKRTITSEEKKIGEKSKGRHPRDQKELEKAQAYIKANPDFGVKYEGVMDIVRRYTDKKKPEKKPEKAMDAGARAKRQLARKVHAKYVSGSTENVPDDIRDHKTWSDFRKHI